MPPEAPIAKLLGQQSSAPKFSLRAAVTKLLDRHRDARECFCDDAGAMKPAAQRLFARLAKEAQLDRIGLDPDARAADYRKGQQDLLRSLALMVGLDTAKLEDLQRRMGDR
jgi:hypothetical protein